MKFFKLPSYILIPIAYILFTTFSFAATLSDDFETNNGGWQYYDSANSIFQSLPIGADPTGLSAQVGYLPHQLYSLKTYNLGATVANTVVNVQFDIYAQGKWDNTDYLYIYLSDNSNNVLVYNTSLPGANNNDDLVLHLDFNTATDASGQITLYILPYSNNLSEVAYLDNVKVSTIGTPPTMGNITNQNVQEGSSLTMNLSTYVISTDGDSILNYTLSCTPTINGMNFNTLSGLFTGQPISSGNYTCNASATDKDGTSNISTFTVTVTAAPPSPPIMLPIPDMNITVNTPISIDLSTYVIPTNGDTVIYTLTGTLPGGLTFNTSTGIINGQATQEINATLTLLATDKDGDSNTSTFIISVQPINMINNDFRAFSLRYQATFYGKMLTIGNTILVAPDKQEDNVCDTYTNDTYISNASKSNDQYELCAYYDDANANFPTTRATLNIPVATAKQVKWAGLYWQALVEDNFAIESMQIKLKHSQMSAYQTIDYTTLDYQSVVSGYTSYSAFANVTQYFVDNNLSNGVITVGNIPVVEGEISGIGSYGAWTLVVIYEDTTEPLQNFSVYDGWQKINDTNNIVDINISGFYTPKNAPDGINAQVSVFTAEGDKLIAGDTLSVRPSKQANYTELIPNMNSAINTTPAFIRTPNPSNNQGIDIQAFELGAKGKNIILPEESSMLLRFYSEQDHSYDPNFAQDTYFPSMVAFSAELYTPAICYDYTASLGDIIPIKTSDTRDINTSTFGGGLPLNIQFLIRSEEADFTYKNAKARITFSGGNGDTLNYNKLYAKMSPPNDNTYYPYTTNPEIESNSSSGQIALGANVIGNANNNGGDIIANETTYAILGYDIAENTSQLATQFDLHFDATITFNPGGIPVSYQFSTNTEKDANGYIPRCETNATYSPIRAGFNVERIQDPFNPEAESTRYTLHTQVTKRPYSIQLVAYDSGLTDVNTNKPLDFNSTVEAELINADAFQNSNSVGYDTTCQNPEALGEGKLFTFDPTTHGRRTVNIPNDWENYPYTRAIRNAAFRLWILTVVDSNGTKRIVTHQCTDKTNSDNCFGNLYTQKIDVNQTGQCMSECTNNNPNCYTCLKNHYATAICSRDNFSIRPDAFFIQILDDNNKDNTVTPIALKSNTDNTPIRLAAGYDYKIDINSTNYGDNTKARGYFNSQFIYQDNLIDVPDINATGSRAVLEFDKTGTGYTYCDDENHSTIALNFNDGSLVSAYDHFRYNNVGHYKLWLSDSDWTLVDHGNYALKPTFGGVKVYDCDPSIHTSPASPSKVGCSFYSANGSTTVLHADIFPYYFSMSNITLQRQPDDAKNYAYFNDFSHPYYKDLLMHPIDSSVTYSGLLIAKGADGNRVSNFTQSCAAQEIQLHATITTNPSDVNATSPLQQYLQHTNVISFATPVDTQVGFDKNVTLPTVAFPDTTRVENGVTIKPGKANIFLHTTLKKPKDAPINPVIVNYSLLSSASSAAWNNADMQSNYIPDGNNTYDRNITYYFAKVTPRENLYNNIVESFKVTPLAVDIYCSFADCNNTYNLATGAINLANNWYSAPASLFDPTKDGSTDLSIKTIFGQNATPSVAPNSNVTFIHTSTTRNDVNVSVTGSQRPSTVDIQVETVPWLSYNPNDKLYGYPHYRVKFIGNSSWSGVGNTGQVTETTSNSERLNRMNW